MMNRNLWLLLLLTFSFLSACQKDGQADSSPLVTSRPMAQGPSDGGGGDTCNGRMIESYKVDVTTLEEYKEFIQPLIDKVTIIRDEKKEGAAFTLTAKSKSWYLIDCKLQDIPKERKGLFLETFQVALHTSREIFIDSAAYSLMSKPEKAKLLLHELIMGYFLMKYLTIEEICKTFEGCSGDSLIYSKWKIFRPETYHPLDSEDHQKIRNVTAWLWLQKDSLTPESFNKVLHSNDFDKRFEFSNTTSESKEVFVETKNLIRMFKKYQWSKTYPEFCQFNSEKNTSVSKCKTEIIAGVRDFVYNSPVQSKQLYLQVKIIRVSDNKEFSQEFTYPLINDSDKIRLYINRLGSVVNAAPFGVFSNWPNQQGSVATEGMKSQMIFFMLNLSQPENPELYQILYQTYVWYAFEDEIVVRDGHKYQETYGYPAILGEESENIFIEDELPFVFKSMLSSKTFIKSNMLD